MKTPAEVTQTSGAHVAGPLWQRLERWWTTVRVKRAPRRLRVLETLQIGEKRQLLVVSVDDRELVVGAAANFLATLAELPAEAAKDDAKEPGTEWE